MIKYTQTILLIDGPTRSHTHTKIKETPEFLLDPPADERDELGVRVRMGSCGSSKVPATRVGLVARGGSRVEQSELRGGDQGRGRDPPRLHEQAGSLTLQLNHRQPTCNHSSTPDLPAPMTTTTESARGYISSHTGRGLWRE